MTQSAEKSKTIHFRCALTGGGWLDDPVFTVDAQGLITAIDTLTDDEQVDESFDAIALPGMPNVHSHAFQRAFAGLSEYRTSTHDSFWTWRDLMYKFLLKLDPDSMYVIARQLYIEMLLAGYCWVGEFHYIHNDINGQPYSQLTELSDAIIRAADDAGIGLCMLPVLYQRGGFDDAALSPGQKRFALSNEQYRQLFDSIASQQHSQLRAGAALHSLRAVDVENASAVLACLPENCPIHVHVAEQQKEIDDCVAAHGVRSVRFLLDQFDVNQNWCLIHATHLDDDELNSIADSGAVVGLCPTTEANLGDGIFRAEDFFQAGGAIAIGSDSHCSVDLREELRLLEYGQRLRTNRRAVLGSDSQSVGRHLYQHSAASGGQAIGVETGKIAVGMRADFTVVDPQHPAIAGASGDAAIDRLIFCNSDDPIIGSVVGGNAKVMGDSKFLNLVYQSQLEFAEVSRQCLFA